MIKGLDISAVQEGVDFDWLVNQGFQFVVIRCGVGNEGVDGLYKKNVAEAKAAGMKVMAYHFVYPLPSDPSHTSRDPVAQAQAHFKAANGELAAIDVEWPEPQDWKKWNVDANFIKQWINSYLDEYTRLSGGKKPLFYTYPNYAKLIKFDVNVSQYPLWIASYLQTPEIPAPWSDYYMWQTGGGDKLTLPNGIKTDTDVVKDFSYWESSSNQETPPVSPPQEVATAATQTSQTADLPSAQDVEQHLKQDSNIIVKKEFESGTSGILDVLFRLIKILFPFIK